MVQTYDIEAVIFQELINNGELTGELTGDIYQGERPINSELEDIVINTIALTQNYSPQLATTNINIHVKDKLIKAGGKQQRVENRERLKLLAGLALDTIRAAKVEGMGKTIDNQATINQPEIGQHYVNIRITWSIHI